MPKLNHGLRLALAGLTAIGTLVAGAAQAVDIKMWNLTNVGYPEFIQMAIAEYKKTHPDVNIIFEEFPNEAYKRPTPLPGEWTRRERESAFSGWKGTVPDPSAVRRQPESTRIGKSPSKAPVATSTTPTWCANRGAAAGSAAPAITSCHATTRRGPGTSTGVAMTCAISVG